MLGAIPAVRIGVHVERSQGRTKDCERCGKEMIRSGHTAAECLDCKLAQTPISRKLDRRLARTEEEDLRKMDEALARMRGVAA